MFFSACTHLDCCFFFFLFLSDCLIVDFLFAWVTMAATHSAAFTVTFSAGDQAGLERRMLLGTRVQSVMDNMEPGQEPVCSY